MLFLTTACRIGGNKPITSDTSPHFPKSSNISKTVPHISPSQINPTLDTNAFFSKVLINPQKDFLYTNDTGSVRIEYGNLFSQRQKHLIVKFWEEGVTKFYFYVIKSDKIINVLKTEIGSAYRGYGIFDVNGDVFKDFVLAWYPGSSSHTCDPKYVYLLKPDHKYFTERFDFSYPTFLPSQKKVIEIGYGAIPPIYKIEWKNKYSTDTIEAIFVCDSIYNDTLRCKNYFLVNYRKNKSIYFMDSLSAEYDSIFDIDQRHLFQY